MNVKLHTPKSLRSGSGISSIKQFLLSLVATSVSIVLTFGTAAYLDHKKKQADKREMVMMIMYDMYTSLRSAQQSDSSIIRSIDFQIKLAKDTSIFADNRFTMIHLMPQFDYTETVERIFSTNIETISTLGNVLFAENVSAFYMQRKEYKDMCDSVQAKIIENKSLATLKAQIEFDYYLEALLSAELVSSMNNIFAQCKEMMNVKDAELEAYSAMREKMDDRVNSIAESEKIDFVFNVQKKRISELNEARQKLGYE